jgi:hypothetical protein
MATVIFESTITCPACRWAVIETMATDILTWTVFGVCLRMT